jgi:dTDP-4-dehydrorhamnose 3,5-epimerase
MMKVVLYDERPDSPTKGLVNEFFMGERNPVLITIPPGVWHGMKCISQEPAMLVNTPTEPYHYADPDEVRADPHKSHIPYDWSRKDG